LPKIYSKGLIKMTVKPLHWSGIKRYLVVMAIMLLLMLCFAPSASGESDYMPGDVNNDGVINVKDVVLVMKHVLNLQDPPLTEVQRKAADVNGDGVIDVRDATEIMKRALGLIDVIPMAITSLDDAGVRVPFGTARQDINFPDTVRAHFAGGQQRDVNVRWEQVSSPPYNPFVFNQYEFKGDLVNLPSGITNPNNLRATAKVSFLMPDPGPFPGPIPPPPPPPPDDDWPIQLDGLPIITPLPLGATNVDILIRSEFAAQVDRVRILGEEATQDPNNIRRWRRAFEFEVTLDQLRRQIEVFEQPMPGELDAIDKAQSTAIYVGALPGSNEVAVWVYIKPGETVDTVTANTVTLAKEPGENRFFGLVFGLNVGDVVNIQANRNMPPAGQSHALIVREVN
jgi:hypothetical protein